MGCMLYITFNDYPGGIYYSQVIDVVKYLNTLLLKDKVRLVAFISLRKFFVNRKKIKQRCSDALVLPMFPGVANWRWNRVWMFFLSLFFFRTAVICRGVFAFHIVYPFRSMGLFRSIVFDARGAYKAEFEEYSVIPDKRLIKEVGLLERDAVWKSDFNLAVSQVLCRYWQKEFQYTKSNFAVIPCTLSDEFIKPFPTEQELAHFKQRAGFSDSDVVVVFVGSASGWQSFQIMDKLFVQLLTHQRSLKILLLGRHSLRNYKVYQLFPDRVFQEEVEASKVLEYLYVADYGWLVRENNVTNAVASPVKFAEYLAGGLKVLISPCIGDYSEFCRQHSCGRIVDESTEWSELLPVGYLEKVRLHQLAIKYFTKGAFRLEYEKILNAVRL